MMIKLCQAFISLFYSSILVALILFLKGLSFKSLLIFLLFILIEFVI